MRNLKKSLVFLVVFAMILSTVAPVFAATPSDVIGTDYEDAVGKLVALGIINGYEDGTFQPEKNISRAEFAKIACYVLGLQSAADLSKGPTKFKDVAAGHWASGYINIAAEKGMIVGYNGQFRPEDNVSYAEAITILVRAIGLGPVVEVKGTWPANYLAKASEVGITDNVPGIDGKAQAIRGLIAKLSWNTLTAEKWGATEYNSQGPVSFGKLGKTLLAEKYSDYVYKDADGDYQPKFFEEVEVIATQLAGALEANEITIKNTDYASEGPFNSDGKLKTKVNIPDFDANAIFGKKMNVLLGKDNKVVFAKVDASSVVEGYVEEFDKTDDQVKIGGKEYSFTSTANIYLNTKNYAVGTFDTMANVVGDSAVKATLVLDSGKISAMNLFVADAIAPAGVTMKQFIVKEIKANGEVKNVADSPSKQFDLDDVTADADKVVFVKNGKKATKDDIKVGDAVTYIENTASALYYIVISDNKVTGTLSKIVDDEAGAGASDRKKLTVDGKQYVMTRDASAKMTKTGDLDDAKAIDGTTLNDYLKKDVTLTLNALGEIILVNGEVKSSATLQYGVVTKDEWEGNPDANGVSEYYIQILTTAGEKKAYAISGEKYKDVNGADLSTNYVEREVDDLLITKGDIVLYDVSASGKIDAKKLYVINETTSDDEQDVYVKLVDVDTLGVEGADTVAIKEDTKKVTVNGTSYYADSKTAYLNMNTNNIEKISGWDKLVSDDKGVAPAVPNNNDEVGNILDDKDFYIMYDENYMIKAIIVNVLDDVYEGSDAKYGVFVESGLGEEDPYITLYIDGQEVTYTVADGVYTQTVSNSVYFVEYGDLVRFELNGDGEFDGAEPGNDKKANFRVDKSVIADTEANADKIDSVNTTSRIITFKAAKSRDGETLTSVVLASDAIVYDVRDNKIEKKSISDLEAGLFVVVDDYDDDKDTFGIVVICGE